jgi:hypothetical protein
MRIDYYSSRLKDSIGPLYWLSRGFASIFSKVCTPKGCGFEINAQCGEATLPMKFDGAGRSFIATSKQHFLNILCTSPKTKPFRTEYY